MVTPSSHPHIDQFARDVIEDLGLASGPGAATAIPNGGGRTWHRARLVSNGKSRGSGELTLARIADQYSNNKEGIRKCSI